MSNLLYKFVVCSDLHIGYGGGNDDGENPVQWYENEYVSPDNGVAGIFCLGDIVYGNNGMYQSRTGYYEEQLSVAREIIGKFAQNMGGLICAGNHEAGNNFGIAQSGVTGIDLWKGVTGYTGYENDPYIVTKTILNDVFVAVSGQGSSQATDLKTSQYTADTITRTERIIDAAISAGKRVFVFLHFPYCVTFNPSTGVYTETDPTSEMPTYGFGVQAASATEIKPARPDGRGNAMFQMLANKKVLWFSGHNHNFWQISHLGGCTYGTVNAYYPYAHAASLPSGALMINLPSMQFNLQDAIVYVYDDKVEVRERQSSNTAFNPGAAASQQTTKLSTVQMVELSDGTGNPYMHTWNVSGGEITTYKATFVADGRVIDTIEFEAGASVLPRVPAVPAKAGYTGAWEPYTLADADITINAVYTAVEPEPPVDPDEPDAGATLWGIGAGGQPVRYEGIKVLYGIDGAEARNKVYDISGGELLL